MISKSQFYKLPLAVVMLLPLCLLIDFVTLTSVTANRETTKTKQYKSKALHHSSKNIFADRTKEVLPSKIAIYQNIPILGFHDVVDLNDPDEQSPKRREFEIDFYKSELKKLLDYLASHDYWFLSADEFFEYFVKKNKPLPPELNDKKPIMLSFDDGYKGLHRNLLPLLDEIEREHKQKIKVVLFVNPALLNVVDGDLVYMSCSDLQEGVQKGFFDVQSHGLTHRHMTDLNVEELSFDLVQAKHVLRQCLNDFIEINKVAKYLAYPYGEANEQVIKYAQQEYFAAFMYNHKLFAINSKYNHTYKIPRLIMSRTTSVDSLIKTLESNYQIQTQPQTEL